MVFIARWSLYQGGQIARPLEKLNRRTKKWSLYQGGLYIKVVFNQGSTVCEYVANNPGVFQFFVIKVYGPSREHTRPVYSHIMYTILSILE